MILYIWFGTIVGIWMLQDGVASIFWYDGKETWKNHIWRVLRAGFGLTLLIWSAVMLRSI